MTTGFDTSSLSVSGTSHADPHAHNLDWPQREREGGEVSGNPFCAGPMFILSEEEPTYRLLADIYAASRAAAVQRGVTMRLLISVSARAPGPAA